MLRSLQTALLLLLPAVALAAEERPLVCFGNEPSWSVALSGTGAARLSLPDQDPVELRGNLARIEPLHEAAWRGAPAGSGRDLVLFMRDGACSDGMSDTVHPVNARVSLPDGRFLAGCCRQPAVRAEPALEGTLWRIEELPGQDPSTLAAARPGLTVLFEEGRASGFSGCNRFAGSYTREGNRIRLGPLAGTMMMCDGQAMELENAFRNALAGTLTAAFADGRLTLTSESGTTAVLREAPAPALEGVTWEVTGFNNGRQAVVSPQLDTALNLTFADGTVTGTSGCNTFRASYTRDGDRIAIGPAATTRKACTAEGVMEQERQFLAALQAATTWTIRDELLDMHFADGARALMARAK
jgi:heat shock protein HslJ